MRFLLGEAQTDFDRTLDRLLGAADTPGAIRAWASGDSSAGRALWRRLADAGVFGLAVPEAYGGVGLLPVELGVAFTQLGRHAVPGPVVETVASAVLLARLAECGERGPAKDWLPGIASGAAMVTLRAPGGGPYALDADAADAVFTVTGEEWGLSAPRDHGPAQPSLDPARRLVRPPTGGVPLAAGPSVRDAAAHAADWAAFATAAQALGAGLTLVERTVTYVRQRTQFGVPIGSFQAVKHRLADALTGLEFARPLVHGAAVALARDPGGAGAEIAAAKAAAGEAAYAAARTALQLHGAIGYTAEYDLSLWIGKARALRSAWGTPSECRARVLEGVPRGVDGP
ncbi:acyl-CoA dehydrogenase family protein [Streptomyces pathocidini]|uniref:Acyl-CoA dehydrogenase family protein n=1 Tax=Streptomyces pathocidini TaxID=1650571 RepID=A0ABW7UPS7_9ACTN|nr:acyl-CoA dehydrogenase family protein [Streptomyces pathocidini]